MNSSAEPCTTWYIAGVMGGPLIVSATYQAIDKCLKRNIELRAAENVEKREEEKPNEKREKRMKAAMHLTKALFYGLSAIVMPPMAVRVAQHFNKLPVQPANPDEWAQVRWALSIPASIYIAEIVTKPLNVVMWIHHGASLIGFYLLTVPWTSTNDQYLYLEVSVIVWSIMTLNCFSYCGYAHYQLDSSVKVIRTLALLLVLIPLTSIPMHVAICVYMVLKWQHFELAQTVAVIVLIDLALAMDHVNTFRATRAMWAKKKEIRGWTPSAVDDVDGVVNT